jgi:UDP-glucose 4-epimerase
VLAVIQGKQPVVYGDGEQSRDFTYIDNIVDEVLRACEVNGISGMVFNGGTGMAITLNEVLKVLGHDYREES